MGYVNKYDKSLYPSINDAVTFILDGHLLDVENLIYSGAALNEVLFFLAENGIQHTFIKTPAPAGALCDEVISVVWSEPGAIGNEVWYSRGATKHAYRVSITVVAETMEEIEDWVSTIEAVDIKDWAIDIKDWSVEEL